MGDFKERTGKTRVGKILQDIGDAGKPILKILSKAPIPGASLLGEVADAIRTSNELTEHEKIALEHAIRMDLEELSNVTSRWQADMASDSWLSKNVRPLVLIFLMLSTMILIVLDSSILGFQVKNEWVELLSSLLITVVVAYFGSRGAEKFRKLLNNGKT